MECKYCNAVYSSSRKSKLKLPSIVLSCPFVCKTCGKVNLEFNAIRDLIFVWPVPKAQTFFSKGLLELPARFMNPTDELSGRSPFGVILSVGGGFTYQSGERLVINNIKPLDIVIYDSQIVNTNWAEGFNGNKHPFIRCGYHDIKIAVEFEDGEDLSNIIDVVGV